MGNNFPIFPKVGNHVRFTGEFQLWSGLQINRNAVAEVLDTKIYDDHHEKKKYIIYLGLRDGLVLEVDYTVHFNIMEIIPSTEAAQVLYGNK